MEVVRDGVNVSSLCPPVSESGTSSCCELPAHQAAGVARLLRAVFVEREVEEVGGGTAGGGCVY